jgi:hypothetical protein
MVDLGQKGELSFTFFFIKGGYVKTYPPLIKFNSKDYYLASSKRLVTSPQLITLKKASI